jgi:fatty-acyl-CoA synthase/feruloyl-CoA synthase
VATLVGALDRNASQYPEREALVGDGRRWTWKNLGEDVAELAGRLATAGLRSGDRCAIVSGNAPEFILALYGVLSAGGVAVPINTRLAPPEVAYQLDDSGAAVVLAAPASAALATAAADLVEGARPSLFSIGQSPDLPDIDGLAPQPPSGHRAEESDDAFIIYTSGTTGKPKGVLMDHHRAIWAALANIVGMEMADGQRYLHVTPMYHAGGVLFSNVTTLLGGTNVILPKFSAEAALDAIEAERIGMLMAVPTILQLLLEDARLASRDLSSWRVAVFGAASTSSSVIEELFAKLPHVRFYQGMSQTESGPAGLSSSPAELQARPDATAHGPLPFIAMRICDPHGHPVQIGEPGELHLRGESVMKGYWNLPDKTQEALQDGWLRTGDIVRQDPDGAVTLVDRIADVIMTGGRNVYSAEVEAVLKQHPAALDCAVIGRPHEKFGETVVAVVSVAPDATLTLDELKEFCEGRIADYKIPRELVTQPLPRNATGKLLKHQLRDSLAEGSDRISVG